MYLHTLQLNEPHWTGPSNSIFEYGTSEISRVLSMGLPAAVVVKLPRMGRQVFLESSTDLLLYFPMPNQVRIFEYTIGDTRRHNQGCDIRYYGTYDASPEDGKPRKATCARYNYVVELMPFLTLHSAKCPDKTETSIIIEHGYSNGTQLEMFIAYDNDNREKESIELRWHSGYNYPVKRVATWFPDMSPDNSILTWATTDQDIDEKDTRLDSFFKSIGVKNQKAIGGTPWAKRLPFIRGYMSEDET